MHRQTWERQTNKQKQCSGEQSQPWGLQASTGPNSPPWLFIDEPSFITVDAFEARPQDLRLTEGPVTPNTHMHRCTHTQGFFTDTRTHKASLIPDRKRKREIKSLVYRVFLPFLSFFFHFQLFFIQWEKNCTIAHKPVTLRTEDNLYSHTSNSFHSLQHFKDRMWFTRTDSGSPKWLYQPGCILDFIEQEMNGSVE